MKHLSSFLFKVESVCWEKPICTPLHLLAAFETVPVLIWLMMALSHSCMEDCGVLPLFTPLLQVIHGVMSIKCLNASSILGQFYWTWLSHQIEIVTLYL